MVIAGVLGAVVLLALFNLFSSPSRLIRPPPLTDYSRFIADVDEGKVEQVTFRGSVVIGRLKDGQLFESAVPHVQIIPSLTDRLLAKGVAVAARLTSDEEVLHCSRPLSAGFRS
jgi:cell division protease FtsH